MTRLFSSPRIGPLRSPDWIWGGLGVSIAGASASFAAYMIATAPGVSVTAGRDFGIFAQFDRRSARPRETVASLAPTQPLPRAAVQTAASGVDFEPTGSIPTPAGPIPAAAETPTTTVARTDMQPNLRDFVVRTVIGNKALIEHRQKLSLVKAGSILDDAGEVLAIERRGDTWVVKTAAGVIGGF